MTDAVEAFAAFVVRACDGIPSTVEASARMFVLDALGCALAGAGTDEATAAFRVSEAFGGAPEATVVGHATRLPSIGAAFSNTMAARIQLYDDTYGPGHMHAGAALTFTSLAVAEALGKSLGDVLRAVAAGAEVASRVGAAAGEVHYARGFHNTGTCVVFGTAAATALLTGLSEEATARALSLAGDHAAGLRRYQLGGSPANSALHAANAAKWGIASAALAGEGFPAPRGMLEEANGFLATFGAEPDASTMLLDGMGEGWRLTEASIKPYPTCRSTHAPASAIDTLRIEHQFGAKDVAAVRVSVSEHAFKCDRLYPKTSLDAQFSIQYVVGRLLVYGALSANDFDAAARDDSDVAAVQGRVSVHCDPALLETHTIVEVDLVDGTSVRCEVPVGEVRGDPNNPLSAAEVEDKFFANASALLSRADAQTVFTTIMQSPATTPLSPTIPLLAG